MIASLVIIPDSVLLSLAVSPQDAGQQQATSHAVMVLYFIEITVALTQLCF